jgi:hypothetical protein
MCRDHVAAFVDQDDAEVGSPSGKRLRWPFDSAEQNEGSDEKNRPAGVHANSPDLHNFGEALQL